MFWLCTRTLLRSVVTAADLINWLESVKSVHRPDMTRASENIQNFYLNIDRQMMVLSIQFGVAVSQILRCSISHNLQSCVQETYSQLS